MVLVEEGGKLRIYPSFSRLEFYHYLPMAGRGLGGVCLTATFLSMAS